MTPQNTYDDLVKSLMVSEVIYEIDSDQVDTKFTQTQKSPYTQTESTYDLKPVSNTLILMPGAIQINRQVPIIDPKISKETKNKLYEMLQKYKAII